jgi:hypothetical protein
MQYRDNRVLKDFDCPAITVRPGIRPPFNDPLKAILRMGSSVLIGSFASKNFDFERTEEALTAPDLSILSNRLIINFPLQ